MRVRFAPSPTGYLHVGGARTALFNWLLAKRHAGVFVLRIEDTDAARNTPAAMAAILDGLRWLGLSWDEGPEVGGAFGPYFQSERKEIYDRYLAQLESRGLVYDDAGAVRFRSPKAEITVDDKVCGVIKIDRSQEPDMTLRRPDGSYIFHFCNVVDDIEMKITHVLRGEDHLMNTPKHLELFQAFGVAPPVYAHIPLFLNQDGSKMSKRDQGASVQSYIDEGFVPAAVRNYLCLLGWSPKDDREILPVEDVIALFDWDHLNRSPSRFDYEKCKWMNAQYLAALDEAAFVAHCRGWLAQTGASHSAGEKLDEALCLMRPKIKHVPEILGHLAMLFNPQEEDAAARAKITAQPASIHLLRQLAGNFQNVADWNADAVQAAIQATAASASVKPGALMFPLRFAVTRQSHGVDLLPALILLGKNVVLGRLKQMLDSTNP